MTRITLQPGQTVDQALSTHWGKCYGRTHYFSVTYEQDVYYEPRAFGCFFQSCDETHCPNRYTCTSPLYDTIQRYRWWPRYFRQLMIYPITRQ